MNSQKSERLSLRVRRLLDRLADILRASKKPQAFSSCASVIREEERGRRSPSA